MSTSNPHVDPAGTYWTGDHDAPSYKPPETQIEDVEADAADGYRKATEKAEREAEIKDEDIDVLSHDWGTVTKAAEYGLATTRSYKANPVAAGEQHRRDYEAWPPRPMPEPEAPEQPPADLEPRYLAEWQREADVRAAARAVPREQARKQQLREAMPVLAEAAQELGASEGKILQQLAGVHLGMRTNPRVADKVTKWFIPQAQKEQQLAAKQQWLDQMGVSALPPDVQTEMAKNLADMSKTGQRTGNDVTDLQVAHQRTMEQRQERADMARRFPEVAGRYPELQTKAGRHAVAQIVRERGESGNWEKDLHTAYEIFRKQRHGGGSIDDDAHDAYRSVMARV